MAPASLQGDGPVHAEEVSRYLELRVFRNDDAQPETLYLTDPDQCCDNLKVKPTRQAVQEMGVQCWMTGLRCTEGRNRTEFQETEAPSYLSVYN